MIWSLTVKNWIFKFIKSIAGRFTSLDIQRHHYKKLLKKFPEIKSESIWKTINILVKKEECKAMCIRYKEAMINKTVILSKAGPKPR